jgi:hypothetical protein
VALVNRFGPYNSNTEILFIEQMTNYSKEVS